MNLNASASEPVVPGPSNSLTDVAGLRVGHAARTGDGWLTGVSVVLAPHDGAVAGVDVRGGGPGTRETDLLDPRNLVDRVHAVVLSGGSAFGLAAADGVMRDLARDGIGFPVGGPGEVVPIVPAAVVFDLGRGGVFGNAPDSALGSAALAAARRPQGVIAGDSQPGVEVPAVPLVSLGSVGAGTGAVAGGLAGGVGTASARLPSGDSVAALVVVNAFGSVVDEVTGRLHGLPFCLPGDLPQLRDPDPRDVAAAREAARTRWADQPLQHTLATTIAVVGTDATLTKSQCAKVAGIAHDGMARAIRPVHTMVDGDTVFALSTTARPAPDALGFHRILENAADCLTRAIVRAAVAAETIRTPAGVWRSYREAFASAFVD